MISVEAVEAVHSLICEESLEDHMDPQWPGRCVKAVQAAAPALMRAAWSTCTVEAARSGLLSDYDALILAKRSPYRKEKR